MSEFFLPYVDLLLPLMPFLIPLPVILPAVAAALALLAGRRPHIQRIIALGTLTVLIVLTASMVVVVDIEGIQTVQLGGWDAPIGITLVADRLSTVMLTVSSMVLFCVMWYAISQGVRDGGKDEPVAVFLPTYMLLSMGVNMSFLAGDLFNLYVGFEVFLVASYVLLTLGASASRVRAGVSYVMVSMVSSMIFLFGLAMVYAAVGTVNLAQIGMRMDEIPSGTRAAIFGVLLVAFGIKAAVFPLDAWLPDSYPTAPSLVTAVFAGLLTKVGVYSIIRMRSVVFTDGSLDGLFMWVALATMIVGILGAMAQNDIKRLLSFTLVSHIGYMIFGIALGSAQGLSGAIFYAVHHILVQTALFLVVGLIERQAGTSSLRRLGSLAYTAPVIAILYLIPALNLGGIPPFSGFLGKIILIEAGANEGSWQAWVLIAGAVITSLLTLYVMVMVWSKGFWRDRKDAPEGNVATARPAPLADVTDEVEFGERDDVGRMPVGMVASTTTLIAASLAVSVLAGPIAGVTDRAAESAQDVSIYRTAVLGTDFSNPSRTLDQQRLDDGSDDLRNREHGLPEPIPVISSTPAEPTTEEAQP
ncbi:Na+/H+ antiporter subunit D [Corynebacterium testudinoris]|uniref:Formate hydrogenlyase subunit 3/multisubunit Na+/H+ antiporter, MnhD subunit n=1 Tax=Corynebacterium testudinoris TaxID=136857 RepID=A0A0G3HCU9_9CORY|nr:Na+/H+ antiporter subunit D [Corynebacterium testudinoris]AKK09768.1 formate hydrogenlyase subunit 3/multisubunit Na+/H+ antiporter, MnhD subunit [Corynebacterium testudinoris]